MKSVAPELNAERSAAATPILAGGEWSFWIRLSLWFAGLMLLWIPGGDLYRSLFVRGANLTAGMLGCGAEIRFEPHSDWKSLGIPPWVDVAVLARATHWPVRDGRKQYVLAKPIATFYQPFTATVLLAALGLATELPWRARVARILGGMVLLYVAMAGTVVIDVVHALVLENYAAVSPLPWWGTLVRLLHVSVTDWPFAVHVIPALIWIAVFPPRDAMRTVAL